MFGIVAINKKNVIGDKGTIPWHFSEDLKFFKEKTEGGTVIVGRKTLQHLPILTNRTTVEVSKSNGCGTDVKCVLGMYHTLKAPVFVIGGASIYDQFMPYINTFFVTRVNDESDGDTKMPESFDRYFEFCAKDRKLSDDCEVQIYRRKIFNKPVEITNKNLDKRPDWDSYFLSLCFLIAQRSIDPHTKHGTVVVAPDHTILTVGYNGPPRNCDDSLIPLERPQKYSWIVHSEEAAMLNAAKRGISLEGSTFYITGFPCDRCTRGIINVGATKIIHGPQNSACLDEQIKRNVHLMLSKHNPPIERIERSLCDSDILSILEKAKEMAYATERPF